MVRASAAGKFAPKSLPTKVHDVTFATLATRVVPSQWRAELTTTLADLVEANAKFLHEVADIKREVVGDDEQ
jgi:hypothetical protein